MDQDLVVDGKNKEILFCTNCPSKILLSNSATYFKCEMELPRMTQKRGATEVVSDLITECFQVKDVLQFENIGSTKPVDNVKYLACADCELGPVGWQGNAGSTCFIAISRVKHGQGEGQVIEKPNHIDENAN